MPETPRRSLSSPHWRLASYDEKYAGRADPWRSAVPGSGRIRMREYARLLDGVSVAAALEVGCARGHFLRPLSRAARTVHAVDLSESAVEAARTRARGLPGVSVHVANALTLRPPPRYGLLALLQVVSDFEPPVQRSWLRLARRLLAPRGLLLCSFPARRFALFDPVDFRARLEDGFEVLRSVSFATRGRSSRWGHAVVLARRRS